MHRCTTFVAATALACCLAGCGGGPKPKALPRDPPSRTPTATTPTPPAMPTAARGTSDTAVGAFAHHYIDLINFATSTGSVRPLIASSAPTCQSCLFIARRSKDIYASGGSIKSDGWRVLGSDVVPNQPSSREHVDLKILQTPQTVVSRKGAPAKTFRGGTQLFSMTLSRKGHSWVVARLDLNS